MIELFDVSLGYVMVPDLRPKGKGSPFGMQWETIEQDEYRLVKFKINSGIYNVTWLHTAYPPRVDRDKPVVLSGKGPIWLFATFARAYTRAGQKQVSIFTVSESGREQPFLGGRKWTI